MLSDYAKEIVRKYNANEELDDQEQELAEHIDFTLEDYYYNLCEKSDVWISQALSPEALDLVKTSIKVLKKAFEVLEELAEVGE